MRRPLHSTAALVLLLIVAAPALAAPEDAWKSRALGALETAEYHFRPGAGGALSAPNRTHDLRTTIVPDGFRMESRTGGAAAFGVAFRFSGYGRDGRVRPVAPGRVRADASRAWIERPGEAPVEWFVNDARGLEHGFTVATRPAGARARDVVLALALDTALEPRAHADGRTLAFARPGESPRLRYSDLIVRDARGEALPARFVLAGRTLEIRYDDRGAVYPVEVDPLATTAWWTVEGTGAFDRLGHSVQSAGDVNGDGYSDVMVGVPAEDEGPSDAGSVWVYYGSAAGLPSQFSPSWVTTSGMFGGNFGHSGGPIGDVNGDGYGDIIVGQPFLHSASGQRAYVYLGSATGLRAAFHNTSSAGDWKCAGEGTFNGVTWFGWSAAGAGDVNGDGYDDVIVGAPQWSMSSSPSQRAGGAIHLWLGRADFGDPSYGTSDDGTAANDDYSILGGTLNAQLGYAVSTAGDVDADGLDDVLVGSPGDAGGAGRVTLLKGNTGIPLTLGEYIDGPTTDSRLGASVAPAGDVNGDGYADVLLGAPGWNGGRGAVMLYLGRARPQSLAFHSMWTGASAGDSLGRSVHTAGDVNGDGYADVLIGRGPYVFNGSDPGSAQFYYGGPSGPGATPDWAVTGEIFNTVNRSSAYGASVAAAGDVDGDGFGDFLVGSPRYGQSEWGRAYLYRGGPRLPVAAPLSAAGLADDDVVGWSVSIAGDVNGDGFDDVVVGSPHWDHTAVDQGAAFLYYGNATGVNWNPDWAQYGQFTGAQLGISVSGAGDVNGDGYAEVLVGAHVNAGQGGAYVWHGSAAGPSFGAPSWESSSTNPGSYYGSWVSKAGDVNGDGFSDIAVGAFNEDAGLGVGQGCAYVYLGSASGLQTGHVWRQCGEAPDAQFGANVTTAGDVNGDGLDDIIVGAHSLDVAGVDRGRAYVYNGLATGVRTTPIWIKDGPTAGSSFGQAVSSAGDVNGDGYSDIIVGAPGHNQDGRVELYYGGYFGPGQTPAWTRNSGQAFSGYGAALATPGDVNLDGYSDLLVGAPFWDGTGGWDCGRAFLYHGGPSGPPASEAWFADGILDFSNIGHMVAGGGDVNDDGVPDIVLGEPGHYGVANRTGRAQLHLGNGPGVRRAVQQIQDCFTFCIFRNVSPQGRAAAPGYTPAIFAHSAAGKDVLRHQTEVEGVRTGFDGIGIVTGVPLETHPGGISLIGSSASCSNNPCHWRIRHISSNPWFPRTPWFSLPHNGPTESDVRTALPVLAADPEAAPTALALAAPWPNPSRGATRIEYALPAGGVVRLIVRDVAGRRVRTLASHWHAAGRHHAHWDGTDESGAPCAAGVYLVQLDGAQGSASTRVSLIR